MSTLIIVFVIQAEFIMTAASIVFAITPLLRAFIADQYLGRYKTLQWSSLFMFLAHLLIIFSAIPLVITHGIVSLAPLIFGMTLMEIGVRGLGCVLRILVELSC